MLQERVRNIIISAYKTVLKNSKLFLENPLVDNYDEKSVVYEILVKEGFGLNTNVQHGTDGLCPWIVTQGDRRMYVTFAPQVTTDQVQALGLTQQDVFVCFDNALNDTTKVNLERIISLRTM